MISWLKHLSQDSMRVGAWVPESIQIPGGRGPVVSATEGGDKGSQSRLAAETSELRV